MLSRAGDWQDRTEDEPWGGFPRWLRGASQKVCEAGEARRGPMTVLRDRGLEFPNEGKENSKSVSVSLESGRPVTSKYKNL